jgi:tyrosyl-tRNA synthetase
LKTIQEIKEERATLAMRDTRTITGVEAFQSPITALYERFSDKAQSKQRVEELKYQDRQVEILQDLLKLYVSYDVIALSREEFEDFIRFMAIDEHFLKTATDVELVAFIKAKFEHYTLLKQDLK